MKNILPLIITLFFIVFSSKQISGQSLQPNKENANIPSSKGDTIVAHFPLDEFNGTNVPDVIGSADGTIIGKGTRWGEGIISGALDFNRAVDTAVVWVDYEDAWDLNFDSSSFSISLLAYFDPIHCFDEMWLIGKGTMKVDDYPPTGNGNWYAMTSKGGEFRFIIDDGALKRQLGVAIPEYKFLILNHIVGVRDAQKDSMYLYLNSELIGALDDVKGNVKTDSMPMYIGNYITKQRKINGVLDDIKIYNYALTKHEIDTMYPFLPKYPPTWIFLYPISYWKLDESPGTDTVADYIGTAHGRIVGDAIFHEGIFGNAIDFSDAADSTLIIIEDSVAQYLNFTDGPFSISLLANFDPMNYTDEIILLMKGCINSSFIEHANGNWYALTSKGREIRFIVDDNIKKTKLGVSMEYPLQQWAHIVAVRNTADTTLELYVNAQLVGSMKDMTGTMDLDSMPLVIGNYHTYNTKINGMLDDILIYDRALSWLDIIRLFYMYDLDINYPPEVWAGPDISESSPYDQGSQGMDSLMSFPLNGVVTDHTLPFDTLIYTWSTDTTIDCYDGMFSIMDPQELPYIGDPTDDSTYININYPCICIYECVFTASDLQYTRSDTMYVDIFSSGCWEAGINKNPAYNYIRAYPNPAKDIINIELNNQLINSTLTLFDPLGRDVYTIKATKINIQIDVSAYDKGLYLVGLYTEKGFFAQPVYIH